MPTARVPSTVEHPLPERVSGSEPEDQFLSDPEVPNVSREQITRRREDEARLREVHRNIQETDTMSKDVGDGKRERHLFVQERYEAYHSRLAILRVAIEARLRFFQIKESDWDQYKRYPQKITYLRESGQTWGTYGKQSFASLVAEYDQVQKKLRELELPYGEASHRLGVVRAEPGVTRKKPSGERASDVDQLQRQSAISRLHQLATEMTVYMESRKTKWTLDEAITLHRRVVKELISLLSLSVNKSQEPVEAHKALLTIRSLVHFIEVQLDEVRVREQHSVESFAHEVAIKECIGTLKPDDPTFIHLKQATRRLASLYPSRGEKPDQVNELQVEYHIRHQALRIERERARWRSMDGGVIPSDDNLQAKIDHLAELRVRAYPTGYVLGAAPLEAYL